MLCSFITEVLIHKGHWLQHSRSYCWKHIMFRYCVSAMIYRWIDTGAKAKVQFLLSANCNAWKYTIIFENIVCIEIWKWKSTQSFIVGTDDFCFGRCRTLSHQNCAAFSKLSSKMVRFWGYIWNVFMDSSSFHAIDWISQISKVVFDFEKLLNKNACHHFKFSSAKKQTLTFFYFSLISVLLIAIITACIL